MSRNHHSWDEKIKETTQNLYSLVEAIEKFHSCSTISLPLIKTIVVVSVSLMGKTSGDKLLFTTQNPVSASSSQT